MNTTVVHGVKPVPWKRTRGQGNKRYLDPDYRAWKESFGYVAKFAHDGVPWDWPVIVGIQIAPDGVRAVFVPLGLSADFDLTPITERPKGIRFDLDNGVKGILDASQGIVIVDERLVVSIHAAFTNTISHDL